MDGALMENPGGAVVTGRFKTSHWEALQNQPILFVFLM
jgi:hypothetical protein